MEKIKKTQEEMRRIQIEMRRIQEEMRRNQEEIRRNEEEIRRNQEEIRRNQEAMRRNQEAMRRNQEEIRRNQEEMRRGTRFKVNNNEINKILEQLPVTKIEDINKLNDENKKCVICLEDFKNYDKSIYLPCFHLFHEKCITGWINTRKGFCPVCRTLINNMM